MTTRRLPAVAFTPRNRLAKMMSGVNRKTFAEHVDNAERRIAIITPALAESIEGDVRAMVRLCRQVEAETFGQSREIGWLALRIIESARLARRPDLAETAKGVWEMIEALSERGVWHTDALRLHAEALSAMASGPAPGGQGAAVVEAELLRLRTAVGATAAS